MTAPAFKHEYALTQAYGMGMLTPPDSQKGWRAISVHPVVTGAGVTITASPDYSVTPPQVRPMSETHSYGNTIYVLWERYVDGRPEAVGAAEAELASF